MARILRVAQCEDVGPHVSLGTENQVWNYGKLHVPDTNIWGEIVPLLTSVQVYPMRYVASYTDSQQMPTVAALGNTHTVASLSSATSS